MKLVDIFIQDHMNQYDVNGLTKKQWIVLKILLQEGTQPQHRLAIITERDKASLTRLLTALEKKGFVKRHAKKEDLRTKLVSLTQEGESALRKTFPLLNDLITIIQDGLSPDDIKVMITILTKVRHNISSETSQSINNQTA